MNDKIANFPAIYRNIIKYEWNLSFIWLPEFHLIARFSTYWL